ncbi:MAG: TolC family protein [Bacteroidales bacterium]|nr:TolC family protein [Bacteroidales bacterium]
MKKFFSFLLVLSLCMTGMAQTLESFLAEVERSNAAYIAEKYNVEIADAQAIAAKVFNDPEFTAEYSDNQDRTLMMGRSVDLGLSYNFNLANARKARIAVAKEEAEITKALLEDYFRNLRYEAIEAWSNAWQAQSILSLKKSTSESMDAIAVSDSLKAALGEIGRVDALESSIESKAMKGDLIQAEAEYSNALTTLSYLAGGMVIQDIPENIATPVKEYPIEYLVALAQDNRADIRAAYLSKSLSEKNLALVKAQRAPDLGVNMGYSYNTEVRNEIAPAPMFRGVTVGVSIPLKFSSANKGERVAAEKAVLQAEAAYEAALKQIEAEVKMAYSSYRAAVKTYENDSEETLAQARTIMDSSKTAYTKGDSSLLDYLLAVQVFNDIAETCISAKAAVLTKWAELLAAIGVESI